MNEQLYHILNRQVANFTVMYMKLHNFHWFITGPHFYQLHEKFEQMYDEITAYLDEVAERLLMLEQKPLATLKACLNQASIKEVENILSEADMIREIINDYELMNQELIAGINLANETNDDVTADILITIKSSFDKHIWMLKALIS